MKLRLDTGSIRLRLASADLDALLEEAAVSMGFTFPDGRRFGYALSVTDVEDGMEGRAVRFDDATIAVLITQRDVATLQSGGSVEFAQQAGVTSQLLRVLVEMDEPCRHEATG